MADVPRTADGTARPEYDVAILGSGMAGTILASVLARNGARVLIVDAGSHPKFAIGESTIPYTSMLMRLIAERCPTMNHAVTAVISGTSV